MSDEISKKLASTKPIKDYVLICTDERTRKMEYISPQLIKIGDDYFVKDLIDDKNKISVLLKTLANEYNNLLTAFNAYKAVVEARIINLENTIKEMGGNL